MSSRPSLVMIGLDAAEPRLVERWMDEGILPNLRELKNRGAYGRMKSTVDWLAGSPWPTFYSGRPPSEHGVYHHLLWRQDQMNHCRPDPDWLPLTPFWRKLGDPGCQVVALDIPMVYPPGPFDGIEVSGWATHDRLGPTCASPPSVLQWIDDEFGPPMLTKEGGGVRSERALLDLRDELIESTTRVSDLAKVLMRREAWKLFMVVFGATHRGGHKLWYDEQARPLESPSLESEGRPLQSALREIYISCDKALGNILEGLGQNTAVAVFSLGGMGPNTSRAELVFPEMLKRVIRGSGEPARPASGILDRLRRRIPVEWRSFVRRQLPVSWQDAMTVFWRSGRRDWNKTLAFPLMADSQGYVRINCKGRETGGIVEPGEEFDRLCERITHGLMTFRDADTGEPVVAEIKAPDEVFGPGARRNLLPDLIVRWASTPGCNHKNIVSDSFGSIDWPTPGLNPDGRSGNHLDDGFLFLAGTDASEHLGGGQASILDLAPTALHLLGLPMQPGMVGRSLARDRPAR